MAAELRAAGHDIQVVRRTDRTGFKAGALEFGMQQTEADYFALFDADFIPPAHFLLETMKVLLVREDVGFVQGRWGHCNDTKSLLTRAQAIGIDGHFGIEQPARAWNGLFMNFNGTAGTWRRQCIDDAGGWEHDTLTEDMDLSYRAQLAGWQPYFVRDLVVPAELPEALHQGRFQFLYPRRSGSPHGRLSLWTRRALVAIGSLATSATGPVAEFARIPK